MKIVQLELIQTKPRHVTGKSKFTMFLGNWIGKPRVRLIQQTDLRTSYDLYRAPLDYHTA